MDKESKYTLEDYKNTMRDCGVRAYKQQLLEWIEIKRNWNEKESQDDRMYGGYANCLDDLEEYLKNE